MPLLLVSSNTVPQTPPEAHAVCACAGVAATEASGNNAAARAAALMCFSGPCNSCCVCPEERRRSAVSLLEAPGRGVKGSAVDVTGFGFVRSAVRFLLANNHCISDPTAGVTQSLRTIIELLAAAGHECRVLTTSRFESAVT